MVLIGLILVPVLVWSGDNTASSLVSLLTSIGLAILIGLALLAAACGSASETTEIEITESFDTGAISIDSGDVVVLTMVGALVIPIVLIVLAGELGRRLGPSDDASEPAPEADATA